jgi:hypothetical protein
MTRLSLQVVYLWRHVSSTALPFILWWSNLEILFGPLQSNSPFIGKLRCQAIQMEHGPYIAERTQNVVYIVRCLWSWYALLYVAGTSASTAHRDGSIAMKESPYQCLVFQAGEPSQSECTSTGTSWKFRLECCNRAHCVPVSDEARWSHAVLKLRVQYTVGVFWCCLVRYRY